MSKNNKDDLFVMKLERMDKYNENNKFESEYYRQIDFNPIIKNIIFCYNFN